MKKDVSMFSSDELAMLNAFCNNAAKEDKKIHGISGNNASTKKPSGAFYNQDKAKTVAVSSNKINPLNQKKKKKNRLHSKLKSLNL